MTHRIAIHCFVSGKVQGVLFRAATKVQADQLGVTGWVRNLPDGRVEVFACGDQNKIEELYVWLKRGPKLAQVEELFHEELPWEEHQEFVVL